MKAIWLIVVIIFMSPWVLPFTQPADYRPPQTRIPPVETLPPPPVKTQPIPVITEPPEKPTEQIETPEHGVTPEIKTTPKSGDKEKDEQRVIKLPSGGYGPPQQDRITLATFIWKLVIALFILVCVIVAVRRNRYD